MSKQEITLYPIREVAEITGVNPVTLRAWQRRYGLIKPQRTEKGHRLYSDNDISLIKTIVGWLDKGVAIRNVKALLGGEPSTAKTSKKLPDTDALLDALAQLNIDKAESIFVNALKDYPLNTFKQQLFEPVERCLKSPQRPHRGLQYALWRTLIIQTLSVQVSNQRKQNNKPCWLLRCGQRGQTLAWLSAYELGNKGYKVNVIDGIEEKLSPFCNLIQANSHTKVFIVGEQRINDHIIKELQRLPSKPKLIGSIASIHRDDFSE